ncbi:MAG: sigma-70 family RNA polymerase sigma factor [Fuerstiella sp.]
MTELNADLVPRLTRYFESKGIQGDDADELAQQTFVKLWKAVSTGNYQERKNFWGYASRAAHNVLIDHTRKLKRSRLVFDEDLLASATTAPEPRDDREESPLRRLSAVERRAFVAVHGLGQTYHQVGQRLAVSRKSVSLLMASAQKKLAELT